MYKILFADDEKKLREAASDNTFGYISYLCPAGENNYLLYYESEFNVFNTVLRSTEFLNMAILLSII